MKRLILSVVIVVCAFVSKPVFAREYPQNPDRFPSIGLNYSHDAGTAKYSTLGVTQDIDTSGNSLLLDTRLPLSNSFTLSLGLGAVNNLAEGKENRSFNADKLDGSSGVFTIGARYYFNH